MQGRASVGVRVRHLDTGLHTRGLPPKEQTGDLGLEGVRRGFMWGQSRSHTETESIMGTHIRGSSYGHRNQEGKNPEGALGERPRELRDFSDTREQVCTHLRVHLQTYVCAHIKSSLDGKAGSSHVPVDVSAVARDLHFCSQPSRERGRASRAGTPALRKEGARKQEHAHTGMNETHHGPWTSTSGLDIASPWLKKKGTKRTKLGCLRP